jgi:predicted CxxxxCH...CXXCH cytochrome family protein
MFFQQPNMIRRRVLPALWLLLALVSWGCEYNSLPDGLPDEIGCTSCHGHDQDPAPPPSVSGERNTAAVEVGAHSQHLNDSAIRKAIACGECHLVPESVGAEGHVDGYPAEVDFGILARNQGAEPSWDHAGATCSSVYCHGATLTGGLHTEPLWTRVDGTQVSCSGCHGNPPPAPHPANSNCNLCHPETVAADGKIDVEAGKHIDGELQVNSGSCNSCHGSDQNNAPPLSTSGSSSTSDVAVGAHQSHLHDGPFRQAINCDECHLVPKSAGDPGHIDNPPAEVTFGQLATAGSSSPSWNRDNATCSAVYCHGATLAGGSIAEPEWTKVDGSQAACGSCHGLPPPSPHPAFSDCNRCHPDSVLPGGGINLAAGKHIDGQVEVATFSCHDCHGDSDSPAPPPDTSGNTDTTAPGVGAHRQHLADSDWHASVSCDQCHVVPTKLADAGHVDSALPAELTWGPLATKDGAQPGYDESDHSCSGTYCHGTTLLGTGTNRIPTWTSVGTGEAACGSCHGLPPQSGHPQVSDCSNCHPCVANSDQTIRTQGAYLHINGKVNFEQLGSCPPPP